MSREMKDYLSDNNKEMTPDWLKNHKKGDRLDFEQIFKTKSVFYPGCGDDGRAIKLFSRAHAAHLFYYVDSGLKPEYWSDSLKRIPINGYHVLDSRELSVDDFVFFPEALERSRKNRALMSALNGYRVNFSHGIPQIDLKDVRDPGFCFFVVFERDGNLGEDHGVERFAIVFIYEDAIPLYPTLFALPAIPAPTWLVVQTDMATHGLFGRGEPLEQVADAIQKYPDYLLVSENAEPWNGYSKIDDVLPCASIDCHGKNWFLYARR